MGCTKVPNKPGVYLIVNKINEYFYVGSGTSLRNRWLGHKWCLRKERHHNPRLQAAWSKYGESAFEFLVLEVANTPDGLLDIEQRWIDIYDAANQRHCYNFCSIANSHAGRKRSDKTRQKISKANKGKAISVESRAKMRDAKLGKKLSPEHIEKVRLTSKGRKYSRTEEWKNKQRSMNEDQIRELRELRNTGWYIHQLADRYGVGTSTVMRIVAGKSYKGVGV